MIFLDRVLRLFHTVRYLKPSQIYRQILHRLRLFPKIRPGRFFQPPPPLRLRMNTPLFFLPGRGAVRQDGWRFSFLNHSKSFPAKAIDWLAADAPKLWRYNLHYFDYLLSPELDDTAKSELIESWISGNPPGFAEAWEAYPVSVRIMNWVKYFQSFPVNAVPAHWNVSLARQVRWLEQRIEYHLLGNHLFKNAVALVFGGLWFGGAEGDKWLQKGSVLLGQQLAEQFLPDGGHFERSPMYHAICTVDCLDLLNLLNESSDSNAVAIRQKLVEVIDRALSFLRDTILPDGHLAVFNDAAHGVAPPPEEILEYAGRLIARTPVESEPKHEWNTIYRPWSGYFGFREACEGLFIDCGPIGPDYQPGHAHCDTLSFEWILNGDRIVVDAGTFDYEHGPRRRYARGTRGHNTLMVDEADQSEVWGVFRVARRARATLLRFEAHDGYFVFEGAHDGYRRLKGKPHVTRRLVRERAGELQVEDRLEGDGWHRADSLLHFRPGLRVVIHNSYAEVFDEDGRPKLLVEFIGSPEVSLMEGEHYPEFGIARPNAELILSVAGALPLSVGYKLKATVQV